MFSSLDSVTHSVDAGALSFWIIVLFAVFLLALLAGYLGGRLGSRF